MDLDRPYPVDEEEFDLEYHALRKPKEIFTHGAPVHLRRSAEY